MGVAFEALIVVKMLALPLFLVCMIGVTTAYPGMSLALNSTAIDGHLESVLNKVLPPLLDVNYGDFSLAIATLGIKNLKMTDITLSKTKFTGTESAIDFEGSTAKLTLSGLDTVISLGLSVETNSGTYTGLADVNVVGAEVTLDMTLGSTDVG
jgi:hypothetical protein